MAKSQKVIKKKEKEVEVIDERGTNGPEMTPEASKIPVRTIVLTDVGDMSTSRIALLVQQISQVYSHAKGGPHYIIPVRHGKITTDILFEKEWLSVVRDTCTVENGEIVLKDGAHDVLVLRQRA